ncbi:MAG: TrkA C-terminal domain-containing protein, partial [Telluria sp.]
NLAVIVRSHDDSDLDILKKAGATEVVPEALESSLMLASHALVTMGVPLRRVVHRVQMARDERYASLRGYFHGAGDVTDDLEHTYVRLHSVTLRSEAAAVGRRIGELALEEVGAEVTTLRRNGQSLSWDPQTVILTGDVLVLRGAGDAVSRAESRLL